MQKFVWYKLLISPAILIATSLVCGEAIANSQLPEIDRPLESIRVTNQEETGASIDSILTANGVSDRLIPANPVNREAMAQVTPVSQLSTQSTDSKPLPTNPSSTNPMGQVTSVSQLGDVQPTDWAFQALQSLVERYGCIEGYPDRTYRGNRAITRYEFAAGLNSCLDRIRELIEASGGSGGGSSGGITQADLVTIRRLQEEFRAELTTLRGRIDALEARTSRLEAQQFSTTTKLSGVAVFNLINAWADGNVKAEGINVFAGTRVPGPDGRPVPLVREEDDPSATLSYLVWLTLNTSFTGKDALVTRLAVGNGNSPVNQLASAGQVNTTGVPFFDQTAGEDANDVIIHQLFYSFLVSDNLRVTFGPRVNWYLHFDFNRFTLPFNGAGTFNSINSTFVSSTKRGAGAVVEWNISKQFEFHAAYLTENIEFLPAPRPSADPNRGLFNGADTITAELTFKPTRNANIRLLYMRSNLARNQNGQISFQPIVGVADDGFGGRVHDATSDTFGVNFDWLVTPRLGFFGRYYYASTSIEPINPDLESGDINAQNIQAGLALPDLGKQGALGTISFVIPFDVLDGREFLASGGGNGGTQYDIEFNYYLPITQNIAVIPGFYIIKNINNFDDNPTVFVGNVRTLFTF